MAYTVSVVTFRLVVAASAAARTTVVLSTPRP